MKALYTLLIILIPFVGFGQKTYVPDDNFEAYLEANGMGDSIFLNDSVFTVNINTVQILDLYPGVLVSDYTGIEDFTALTYLKTSSNWPATYIDVSYNIALEHLDFFGNQLTSLDVSQNTALTYLRCSYNQLTTLDLSNNIALEELVCSNNQISSLDLSNQDSLYFLNCAQNSLTQLDLRNTNISTLFATGNFSLFCIDIDNPVSAQFMFPFPSSIDTWTSFDTNCIAIEPTWDCNNDYACVELSDGSGYFQSLEECDANCSLVEPTWDCNANFACIEQTDGSGNFQSLEECEANCSFVEPSWDCNANFACIEQSDGSGNFQSLEECEANCNPIQDSWNCVNDACVDPMNGTGIYGSLEECEVNCNATSIVETNLDINIYPNPSSNIFNLEFNSDSETEIIVTNILAEQVYLESTNSIGEFNTQIDLSNHSKGIYNLTIKTSDGISNHKLILQ